MSKSTHFFGQPVYGQLIKSLDHDKIVEMSRKNGGERNVKSFDGYAHLVTMLYAVIMRFDSLREIEAAVTAQIRKLHHVGIKKGKLPKLISLLTNDFDMPLQTIVTYRRRWQIESLFKQIKQNFPLRYFYGESDNAIKIQIWVTLIANLLLSLLQSSIERRWSFSGLATMVRIVLMEYLNMNKFFNMPDADMKLMLETVAESPLGVTENE